MFDIRIGRAWIHFSAATLVAAALLALTACAAPPTTGSAVAAEPPEAGVEQPAPPAASPTGPVQIDRSCKTDADCTVKNVGNCCGYYPACVNVNSPTDPEGVKAACAESGMSSVCGFPVIEGCQCVNGSCEAQSAALPAIE
ncbi:hypothetical protein [Marilutibacter chinensis]|uniref:Secreted protein n=1 Tax=Marilutibacter chinensis TaxID=2912247 RepID=A0ABS9HUZ0_9GAMM|nr:hypothetical protein [Lysobacter chinensis]MCF7221917.1 hypothetical protein [Lysobacter chinensis]